MPRAIQMLLIAVLTGFFCLNVSIVFGEDAAQAGADIANDIQNSEAAKTLKQAFTKGDWEAWKTLGVKYLPGAVAVILVFIVCFMVASFLGRVIGGIVASKVDVTFGRFITKMIRNGIMFLVLLGVLGFFEIDITGVAAILAALGFAVGMALQGTLSNFAAGIMLLVFRPFKVDDYIVVDGAEGTVEEIDLFTTRLNTLDNRHIIVPNGEIFGNSMENYTHNEFRRVDVNVGADYSADIEATRQAIQSAIQNIQGAVSEPAPQAYLCELGGSSVDWQARVWCRPADYWAVRERVTQAVKESLDAAEIGIPYPQMDVHLVGQVLAKSTAA